MEILASNAKPLVLDVSKAAAEKHVFAAARISIDTFYYRRKVADGEASAAGSLVNHDRRKDLVACPGHEREIIWDHKAGPKNTTEDV